MRSTDTYLCRSMGDDRAFLEAMKGPTPTESGVAVTHPIAMTNNAVWSAVQKISGDVAKLPFNLYRRLDIGEKAREVANNHPTQRVIRRQASPWVSQWRFWRTLMFQALLWNRAYAVIERDAQGRCNRLYNIHPYLVTPEPMKNDPLNMATGPSQAEQEQFTRYRISYPTGHVVVSANEILDITGLQHDGSDSIDLVAFAKDSIALGLSAETFLSKFYANGNNISGVIELPPNMTSESAANFKDQFDRITRGVKNAMRTPVFKNGEQYHPVPIKNIDEAMAALLAEHVKDVARWFNIPPSKIGGDDRGVYGSREQDARDYLDSTLQPWLTNIASQCWLKLLSEGEKAAGYYFEHNTGAILETDIKTKYEVGAIGVQSGFLSPNEFRAMINLNPREDDQGDIYYHSNNMTPMIEGQEPQEPQEPPTEPVSDEVAQEVQRQFEADLERELASLRAKIRREVKRYGQAWVPNHYDRLEKRFTERMEPCARPLALVTGQDSHGIVANEWQSLFQDIQNGSFYQ